MEIMLLILYILGAAMTYDAILHSRVPTPNWAMVLSCVLWPALAVVGILLRTLDWMLSDAQ